MTRAVWIVVLCASAILGISVGIRQSFGLFLIPVSLEVGGARELFALSIGLMNLIWGAAAPFAGAISDRYGTGRVAALGSGLYAVGLLALTASGDGSQLILGGLLIGLGLSGTGFTVVLGAVGRAAPPEKRSAALGIVSVGGSIGQFAALPYAQALIDGFGWSMALALLASTALLMVLLARGTVGHATVPAAQSEQTVREALAEARRHGGFLLLTAGFFVCGFHLAFVAVHLPAYVGDQGMPGWLGATALAVIGLCNIAGTYVCGILGGRYPKKTVLSLLYLARAGIFVGFLVVPVSETSILVLSGALGLLWLGTVPLTSGLVAHIFGPAWMSMLFGIVFLSHQVGGFLGAWLAGWLYDLLGSYDIMWWLSIALGLASAALHWPIAKRPVARLRAAAAINPA